MTLTIPSPDVVPGAADQVVGNVASGATDSGNPVKIGGVSQDGTAAIPAFTNGQRGNIAIAPNGGVLLGELAITGTAGSAASLTWGGGSNAYLDVSGYAQVSLHFSSVGSGNTIVAEGSDENTFAAPVTYNIYSLNSQTSTFPNGSIGPLTTGNYVIPVNFKFLRVRVSVYGSGTLTAVAQLKSAPWVPAISAVFGSLQPASTTNTSGGQLLANAMLGNFDDVAPTVPTENNFAPVRMNVNRALYTEVDGNAFLNIVLAAPTTTVVKSGAGRFHKLIINKAAATGVITIYDNTAASGTLIGTITQPAALLSSGPVEITYDLAFSTGLTIVTATAAQDLTVTYR